jgi:hypothetical protein
LYNTTLCYAIDSDLYLFKPVFCPKDAACIRHKTATNREKPIATLAQLQSELTDLRMTVAIDSAMLLSIVRRMSADQLAQTSTDFLEVCEGLSIKTLFSEMDDHALQAAQKRRDWWVGLVAELMTDAAMHPKGPSS